MKKLSVLMLIGALTVGTLAMTGCGGADNTATDTAADTTTDNTADTTAAASDFDTSEAISVVSREDGSGTRGAFIELFGVEEKDENGDKVDYTTDEAIITNSTDVMMTTVAGDDYAIGYCSLGSLNDTVKAVTIDGAEATVDNIKSGSYTIARPFNIVTKDGISGVAQDFINYILSADGQQVVSDNGYIAVADNAEAFTSDNSEGKIVVAGSSSVSPVMEKLKEAYTAVNPDAEIEIQTSDSTTGVESAISGICDIGMASRELKDTETSQGVKATAIALDGIAVVVNKANTVDDISTDTVKGIYTGDITSWADVK